MWWASQIGITSYRQETNRSSPLIKEFRESKKGGAKENPSFGSSYDEPPYDRYFRGMEESAVQDQPLSDPLILHRIAAITESASLRTDTIRSQRRRLLNEAATLVGADHWLWCYSRHRDRENNPRNVDFQHDRNATFQQGIEHAKRAYCIGYTKEPQELVHLHSLIRKGKHFTRLISDVVPDWASEENVDVRNYVKRCGIDDLIYSITPLERQGRDLFFVGIAVGRKTGRERFTATDREVIHELMVRSPWLFREGLHRWAINGLSGATLAALLSFYGTLERRLNKEIAGAIGKKEDTVRKEVAPIVKELGFTHRKRLIDKWHEGDERA